VFAINSNYKSIGEVLAYLKNKNISNIEERAKIIQDFIDKENLGDGNAHDRYLENGSSTLMNVISEHSGIKKECILWLVHEFPVSCSE
jgi:hypothetical protein